MLVAKAFPDSRFFSRVSTWESRIENFSTDKPDEDDYQIEKAKIAIASGGVYGLGPGKSVQKNFDKVLRQLSSGDFKSADVRKMGDTSYYRARLDIREEKLALVVRELLHIQRRNRHNHKGKWLPSSIRNDSAK